MSAYDSANNKKYKSGIFSNTIRLLRAPAFMLSFIYLLIFTVASVGMLNYIDLRVQSVFNQYFVSEIDAEFYDLHNQYQRNEDTGLSTSITERARIQQDARYLFRRKDGSLTGNIPQWPQEMYPLTTEGAEEAFQFASLDGTGTYMEIVAKVFPLNDDEQILIGRDIGQLTRLKRMIRRISEWAIILAEILGCTGGFFIASRVLSRIDAMSEDTLAIMNNDLSGRLKVTGSHDEIDRLAENINEMLNQIEELMIGLRQVSDNIAHDLKTPLTRLRNKAYDAMNTAKTEDELRDSLDYIIEESDNLIKVFNALLTIARMEAGHASDDLVFFDSSSVVADVAELYEALAEDEGIQMDIHMEDNLGVYGNRELLGQAVANLLDNALKYGRSDPNSGIEPTLEISATQQANFAVIAVADRGPGIPDIDKDKVLMRFTRLESSRTQPGFGLGLSLVAAVASLHGGYVKLENNNPGLIVKLVIPLKNKKVVGLAEHLNL